MHKDQSYLFAWPEKSLGTSQHSAYQKLIGRRLNGEPIAYILGQREFWSLTLKVTPATLIPRPETEQLVELALSYLDEKKKNFIADLGTGSGAIAAAIASERPHWQISATDYSTEALAIAKENFIKFGLDNISSYQGSWCDALPNKSHFDLIISNPPYINSNDPHLKRGDLISEPLSALASGEDGLKDIRIITQQTSSYLKSGGRLLLEHGLDQGDAVRGLLEKTGFRHIKTHKDLSELDRVSEGTWAS